MAVAAVKILLVDDRPQNLIALEELLRQDDRELFRASSGSEALRLLLKHEFALVLLDVEMPVMDGYETAQLMRGSDRTRLVPIIFVTAGDRSEERQFRGYEAGAVDFLYKPINQHTLKSKVDVFIELHRKTAELERTSRMLRERIADLETVSQTLAHDLRAPLRTIRGFSEMLGESLQGKLSAEDADSLDRVIRGGVRMTAMVDDLFALLQLSTDDAMPFDLDTGAVLKDALENLRSDIEHAHATVTQDELPRVRGNRMLVGQIFQNLIGNSIKFRGHEQPVVHVSAERLPEAWRFAVRDNGIGIEHQHRERVFKLLERVSNAASGSGVGLALCRRAVEKLGGRIWIGDNPPRGTTFYFTIPRPRPVDVVS
ncbi:response regulator [soil metagenome]